MHSVSWTSPHPKLAAKDFAILGPGSAHSHPVSDNTVYMVMLALLDACATKGLLPGAIVSESENRCLWVWVGRLVRREGVFNCLRMW